MTSETVSVQKPVSKHAVCTIVSKNYFAYARTLVASYQEQHPTDDCYVLVVDESSDRESFACMGATVFFIEDLKLPHWRNIAFRFDIMELNTNVKPSFLKFLLSRGHTNVVYLDPDIFVYSLLDPVYEALSQSEIVVTPHAMTPLPEDGCRPLDRDLLKAGSYNLGFIGVKDSSETSRFLNWWEERCLSQGFNEPSMGWFVDQHWIDLVPSYFNNVHILRHPGCNVAYWNLHERDVIVSETGTITMGTVGLPLVFFHFSGIDANSIESLSKHQNRFNLDKRPELRPLFEKYSKELLANDFDYFKSQKYGFGYFTSGESIQPLARRYYAEQKSLHLDSDPFSDQSATFKFMKSVGVIGSKTPEARAKTLNSMTVSVETSKSLTIAGEILRLTLKVLGPQRFDMLSRFMRYYGVPNNQAQIMFRKRFGPN